MEASCLFKCEQVSPGYTTDIWQKTFFWRNPQTTCISEKVEDKNLMFRYPLLGFVHFTQPQPLSIWKEYI